MKFGSVCSGIEAASVAWSPLGWKAEWLAEIEKFPSAILAHHYPKVKNLGDMTQIAREVLSGSVSAPDVLTGGTPCQAFSVAGMREGLTDPRGELTMKFVELADAIDYVRAGRREEPSIIIWENVPGVLSDKGNAFGCFLGALTGEDCELLAPGKRWQNAGCVYGPKRAIAWRVLDAQYFGLAQRRKRVFVVASAREGFDPAEVLFEFQSLRRDTAPSRSQGQDSASSTSPGIDLRNGVMTGELAHTVQAGNHAPDPGGTPHVFSVALRGREGGGTAELGDDLSGTLRASTGGGDKPHILAFNSNARPDQMQFDPCVSASLTCSQYSAALTCQIVRRLTPIECERLQGFPDDYTQIPWRNKSASECPDGPRYKAIGNSWAVPVARWVGMRVMKVLGDSKHNNEKPEADKEIDAAMLNQ